jgi:archaellum component FlaC
MCVYSNLVAHMETSLARVDAVLVRISEMHGGVLSNGSKLGSLGEKMASVETKLASLDAKLESVEKQICRVAATSEKLSTHIDMVEGVYEQVRHPLDYVCNKVNATRVVRYD